MGSNKEDRRSPSTSFIHGIKVRKSVAQAAPVSGTDAIVTWDVEDWDSVAVGESKYHSIVTNTTQLIAPREGKYTLKASLDYAANATGLRSVGYKVNGGATLLFTSITAAASDTVAGFVDIALAEGDYVEIVANHTAGATLDVEATVRTFATLQFNGY
jgi:hypothetical protein